MPLANSINVTASANEQPGYSVLWHPYAVNTAGSVAIAPGMVMAFTTAGVGTTPGPTGDAGSTAYTVAMVDQAPTTTGVYLAGVCLGVGAPGQTSPVPNTIIGLNLIAMCAQDGICQVLCDSTTTIGHTLIPSTTVAGAAHDTAGTGFTVGSTIGVALQAVTISSGTALVWANIHRF